MSFFLTQCLSLSQITTLDWDGVSPRCWCSVDCSGSSYEINVELSDLNTLWPYSEQALRVFYNGFRSGREAARSLNELHNLAAKDMSGSVWMVSRSMLQWHRWTETSLEKRLPGEDPTILVCGRDMGVSLGFAALERNAPGFTRAWDICGPLELDELGVTLVLKALLAEPLLNIIRTDSDARRDIAAQLLRANGIGLSARELVDAVLQPCSTTSSIVLPLLSTGP
jgi:hypothetical protein